MTDFPDHVNQDPIAPDEPGRFSPSAEPVAWATFVALVIGALASYGLGVTPELRELILYAAPVVLGAIWARAQVWSKPSHDAVTMREFMEGYSIGHDVGARVTQAGEEE